MILEELKNPIQLLEVEGITALHSLKGHLFIAIIIQTPCVAKRLQLCSPSL